MAEIRMIRMKTCDTVRHVQTTSRALQKPSALELSCCLRIPTFTVKKRNSKQKMQQAENAAFSFQTVYTKLVVVSCGHGLQRYARTKACCEERKIIQMVRMFSFRRLQRHYQWQRQGT